jgi:3-oxoacyl-[acyl-carrier protein] reductase
MDLGVAGRRAIICASSQGLGRACAEALVSEDVHVVINGRDAEKLKKAAAEIASSTGGNVSTAVGDLTTREGREALLAACPEPDILVTNNAGPAPGGIEHVTADALNLALQMHYLAPIDLVRAVLPGMRQRRFGRIVNITSAMVTTPHPMMLASTGARAGLTAVMKAVSREVAVDNVTINNILPERIDSPRQVQMANLVMAQQKISFEEAWQQQAESIAAKRHGKPAELGATCAFLCSQHAGYISGMNIHLDGGSYPGLV